MTEPAFFSHAASDKPFATSVPSPIAFSRASTPPRTPAASRPGCSPGGASTPRLSNREPTTRPTRAQASVLDALVNLPHLAQFSTRIVPVSPLLSPSWWPPVWRVGPVRGSGPMFVRVRR